MRPETVLAITMLALALAAIPLSAQAPARAECESAWAKLNDDGSLEIRENLTVNPPPSDQENITINTVATPVYAEARTPDGVVLPLSVGNGSITITLLPGTSAVRLYYVTLEATTKQGEKWILSLSSPCPITLVMPTDAVPASVSPEPRIVIVNGTVAFRFPQGSIRVEYFLAPDIGPGGGGGGGSPGGGTGAPGTSTGSTSSTSSGGAPGGVPGGSKESGGGASTGRLFLAGAAAVAVAVAAWLLYRQHPQGAGGGSVGVEAALLDERDKKIVEALRGKPEGLTASELIEATGIPKTPLYRRLNRLARQGVIEYYDEGGIRRYRLRES